MNTLNSVGLGLVIAFCTGFVLLIIASLLGGKITGKKILGGLKWLLLAPFRFLFMLAIMFPLYLITIAFGFLSKDTIKGLAVIRKEIKGKLVRECLATMLPGAFLGAFFMIGLKTAFGEYTLVDLIWKEPLLPSQYQSNTLVFNWIALAIGILCLLNWPRRFCWNERHFVKEARAYENDCNILDTMFWGFLCFIIFPPMVFILAIENAARRKYFLALDNVEIQNEDRERISAFKEKTVFELTCWGIILVLGNIVIAADLAIRLFL